MTRYSTYAVIVAIFGFTITSHAALTLTDGSFTNGGAKWNTDISIAPKSWDEVMSKTGENGGYGEPLHGYGSGNVAALKAAGVNAWYQQTIGVVGEQGGVRVNYDGGIRWDASYSQTPRTITLRVSLWDVTADKELAHINVDTKFDKTETSLSARSHSLYYYSSSDIDGHKLALRFSNVTAHPNAGGSTFHQNTVIVDHVSVTALPKSPPGALLGIGGFSLILRQH